MRSVFFEAMGDGVLAHLEHAGARDGAVGVARAAQQLEDLGVARTYRIRIGPLHHYRRTTQLALKTSNGACSWSPSATPSSSSSTCQPTVQRPCVARRVRSECVYQSFVQST